MIQEQHLPEVGLLYARRMGEKCNVAGMTAAVGGVTTTSAATSASASATTAAAAPTTTTPPPPPAAAAQLGSNLTTFNQT